MLPKDSLGSLSFYASKMGTTVTFLAGPQGQTLNRPLKKDLLKNPIKNKVKGLNCIPLTTLGKPLGSQAIIGKTRVTFHLRHRIRLGVRVVVAAAASPLPVTLLDGSRFCYGQKETSVKLLFPVPPLI